MMLQLSLGKLNVCPVDIERMSCKNILLLLKFQACLNYTLQEKYTSV